MSLLQPDGGREQIFSFYLTHEYSSIVVKCGNKKAIIFCKELNTFSLSMRKILIIKKKFTLTVPPVAPSIPYNLQAVKKEKTK
jgi:hypothetical protein